MKERNMSILEARKVAYRYPSGQQVLTDIDLAFEENTMYVILGPSGCGNTTCNL
jgi:ABC-type Fe3+/spermidine/putrescine transport system ATPase subunit